MMNVTEAEPGDKDKSNKSSKIEIRADSLFSTIKGFQQLVKKDLIFLTIIAAFSVIIVWLLRHSPWPWDPMFVFQNATYISEIEPKWKVLAIEHRAIRLGLVGLVSIAQRLFGYSEASYYAVPLISITVFTTGTYALARLVMDRWRSLVVPLLAIFNPVVLPWASHIFPDIPAAGFFTWGVFFLILPYRFEKINFPWWLPPTLAGLCFGYAAITREAIIVCAPLVITILAFLRPKIKTLIILISSSLAVFFFYIVALKFLTDSWTTFFAAHLDRVTLDNPDIPRELTPEQIKKRADGYATQGTIWRALNAPFKMLYSHWDVTLTAGILLFLSPLAGIYSLIKKKKFIWLIGVWIFVVWLSFALAGQLQGEGKGFVFLLTKDRYWAPLYPGLAVGGAYIFFSVVDKIRKKFHIPISLFSLVICILILIPGWQAYNNHVNRISSENHFIEFRNWLISHEESGMRIYAGLSDSRLLRIYSNDFFGNPISDLEIIRKSSSEIPSNRLIADRTLIPISLYSPSNTGKTVFLSENEPDQKTSLISLPENWAVQFVSSDTKLILIGPSTEAGQQLVSVSSLDDENLKRIPLKDGDEFIQIRWTLTTDSHKRPKIFCYLNNGERAFSVNARHTSSSFIDGHQTVDSFCPGLIDGLPTTISVSVRSNSTREETELIEIISHDD